MIVTGNERSVGERSCGINPIDHGMLLMMMATAGRPGAVICCFVPLFSKSPHTVFEALETFPPYCFYWRYRVLAIVTADVDE